MHDDETRQPVKPARRPSESSDRAQPHPPAPGGGDVPPARSGWQLPELVTAARAQAPRVDRNLWLVNTSRWLTHDVPAANAQGTPFAVLRLRHLLNLLDRQPAVRQEVIGILGRLWHEGDAAALFADSGLTMRQGLAAGLWARWRARWLPPSPDTANLALLFGMMLPPGRDLGWLAAIDEPTLQRVASLFSAAVAERGPAPSAPWWVPLALAVEWLATRARATALSPDLRERLKGTAPSRQPFDLLVAAAKDWRDALHQGPAQVAAQQANLLRGVLQACRDATEGARDHLREHGLSANLLLDLQQLDECVDRIDALLSVQMAPQPAPALRDLVSELAAAQHRQRSASNLLREHFRLLARKVAERHALSGEHYVARNTAEYRNLVRKAAVGGGMVAGITLGKFALVALGLAPLWSGLTTGSLYAGAFVAIFLLHGTLATKQPAMTAATLAARLGEMQAAQARGEPRAGERVVDEIAALLRSQMAGVIGNLGAVIPVVAGAQALAWWMAGRPLIGPAAAQQVLDGLNLLGPTPLYAAFTGCVLFASSLIGGWAENAFAFHQLRDGIANHPAVVARLGAGRARRWADWWRGHVNGVASNLSLGLMLGLIPVLATFAGLPLDVRHVTLATGQLTAAVGTLGWATLSTAGFWWCVAGIVTIGLLNLGVSFVLALRLAMRARGIGLSDQRALRQALWDRLRRQPSSFVVQPKDPADPTRTPRA